MEILNYGNILPFYINLKSKMRHRAGCKEFNWAIPVNQGNSLSVELPVEAGATYFMELFDADELYLSEPVDNPLIYQEDSDGNAWVTLPADIEFLNGLDCGVYSIRIWGRPEGIAEQIEYFSEDFRIMNIGQKELAYKLVFSNDTDIDGIIYQTGYEQTVWILDAVFDTPQVVEVVETATDGDSVEVITFQSVQIRSVLKFPYFPDFWQGVFHRLRMIDNLSITKLETYEVFDISNSAMVFTTEDQDVCFKKGVLSWISSTQVMVGCETNVQLI